MTELIGVYGASGFGREVAPLVNQANPSSTVVFIDDNPQSNRINERDVLTFGEFLARPASSRSAVIAIAESGVRETLDKKCRKDGIALLSVEHSSVIKLDDVQLGEGAILCSYVILTSNVRIGRSFHANIYSYIAHDCVIGDFVTFAPGVHCNGNVHIGDHAYIGTGAILRQGRPGAPLVIGAGAVVGMGAVVTRDVAPGTTVVGNPARPLVKD